MMPALKLYIARTYLNIPYEGNSDVDQEIFLDKKQAVDFLNNKFMDIYSKYSPRDDQYTKEEDSYEFDDEVAGYGSFRGDILERSVEVPEYMTIIKSKGENE